MATTLLFPGFLTQALTYGFRIGTTQIAGCENVETLLSDGQRVYSFDEAVVREGLRRLDSGTPAVMGLFAQAASTALAARTAHVVPKVSLQPPDGPDTPGPPELPESKDASASKSAREHVAEGFAALLAILAERMEKDVEAGALALHIAQIPLAPHDPNEYDRVSIAFLDAADEARRAIPVSQSDRNWPPFLKLLEGFPDVIRSTELMDIFAWSLRTLVYVPAELELPAVILQLLTAQIEWKMALFGPAADSLKDVAHLMRRLRAPRHDRQIEAHLHYLAGTALLVTSFLDLRNSFGESSDAFQQALLCYEQKGAVPAMMHERFSQGFFTLGEILATRGRMEEASVQYALAVVELELAGFDDVAETLRRYAEGVVKDSQPVQTVFAPRTSGSSSSSGTKN